MKQIKVFKSCPKILEINTNVPMKLGAEGEKDILSGDKVICSIIAKELKLNDVYPLVFPEEYMVILHGSLIKIFKDTYEIL